MSSIYLFIYLFILYAALIQGKQAQKVTMFTNEKICRRSWPLSLNDGVARRDRASGEQISSPAADASADTPSTRTRMHITRMHRIPQGTS